MKLRNLMGSAVALLMCAAPAMAHDHDAIRQAYQAGQSSGQTPETAEDLLQCSTHWFAWMQMGDVEFADLDTGIFGAGLSGDASVETLDHWDQAAYQAYVPSKGEAAYIEAAQTYTAQAMKARAAFAQGDYGLMRTLGTCSR